MRYVDEIYKANCAVSVYENKGGKFIRDFYFYLESGDKWSYAVRWVCNNYPMYVGKNTCIKTFGVTLGRKVGVC